MYLKSIEMQGFKSFASKMKMDFHDGVTGIVGPNGSGKSNVADAVRWVLGEQSAKQLRGGNMQDVIFAGTESRKPLGFASVSITLDNSGKELNIDYPEVTVTRRLYRSGESEYMLNGTGCRLRDIQELFYDTGIGKEGYSIIGQGQIDRIISDKPEDRRELFDEAVGIVKYKRRKTAALKKLEGDEQNLLRLGDILTELTRQVGPLEKQAEKARTYLAKREELKERDLALFVINEARIEESLKDLNEKNSNAREELEKISAELEKTKKEYEDVSVRVEELDAGILDIRNKKSDAAVKQQQLENQISILEEQIKGAASNRLLYEDRISGLNAEKARHLDNIEAQKKELEELEEMISRGADAEKEAQAALDEIQKKIEAINADTEKNKNELLALVEGRASIKGEVQKYKTLDEQIEVQFSSLTSRILKLEDQKRTAARDEASFKAAFDRICQDIEIQEKLYSEAEEALAKIKTRLTDANTELDEAQTLYHRNRSLLESLTGIAERFEGYGNSVRKVLEQKESNPGIHGVVADLITVEKKYETAIETALGGSLQNVVTDNEATAKYLIEYLKRGKYGRVTFLPVSSMKAEPGKEDIPDEEGILGRASELVTYDSQYKGIVHRLLGRTYVVDTIDHAIGIGCRTGHRYRLVTLGGELFNPGGAITGGAYKHSANLLGRKRQIEELEAAAAEASKKVTDTETKIAACKEERNGIRKEQAEVNDKLKKLYIEKNTAGVRLKVAEQQSAELLAESDKLTEERQKLEFQRKDVAKAQKGISTELDDSTNREKELEEQIEANTKEAEKLLPNEQKAMERLEQARLSAGALDQKKAFIREKIETETADTSNLNENIERITAEMENDSSSVAQKHRDIETVRGTIESAKEYVAGLEKQLEESLAEKEALSSQHKDFFTKREELTEHRAMIDKECFRLDAALERLETEKENAIAHLWDEYEITPPEIRVNKEDTRTRGELTREIGELKREIRELGSVNVNAIEEYKEVRERHAFLSTQYDDIVKSAESLKGIIGELDQAMKKQFGEKFADIRKEFDTVFRQLFGGGKGTLELLDENDLLETGVRIIAQPPGKKLQNMMQLSGGEKALTAIALLFAIQNLKPSPFCLLDEIEAALDESNVGRFAAYLQKLKENTQFIVITHRRGTMDCTDRLYGITMQEKGISAMVSVDLVEGDLE
ncbi:MAG: chromosome segregation protein SMC [Lachnospiraceae bacterium]|nr:chromosome segregation protein SMC [Lachnospiraceae bacterium]